MEIRRRNPETLGPEGEGKSEEDRPSEQQAKSNPLVNKGIQLYNEAEQSGFQNVDSLNKGLQYLVEAAEDGVDDAIGWISTFLSVAPSKLPTLPNHLLKVMHWVVGSNEAERKIRGIAKTMFSKMAQGSGETKMIPKSKIDESAQLLLSSSAESHPPGLVQSAKELRSSVKRLLHSAMLLSGSDEVTEDTFCEAAVMYARGELISPQERTELTEGQLNDFNKANLLKKAYVYPRQTLQYVKGSLLKGVERRGVKWLWSSFPTKQFYLLLAAYFLPMLNPGFIISTICTVIFAVSFLAMSISTMEIILNSEKIFSFMEYSSVFQYFSTVAKVDTKEPEKQLIRRSIGPYVYFFVALLFCLLSLGLSHQHVIIYEILCLAAGALSLVVFVQFQIYKSPLIIVSVLTRLISWVYVVLLLASSWIPIPEFFFLVAKQMVTIPVISLGINFMTLVQFPIQLTVIIYLLYRNSWHNFYTGLGPYALFVSWWVLCRNFLIRASLLHLFEAAFGVAVFIALLPFIPLAFLFSPIVVLLYYGVSTQLLFSLLFVAIAVLFVWLVAKNFKLLMEAKWLNIPLEYIMPLQILVSIPLILIMASIYTDMYTPSVLPTVSVKEYAMYCGPQNWEGNNMVKTQLDCIHLRHRLFEAHGTVQSVQISQIVNEKEMSLISLPFLLQDAITCFFGQTKPICEEGTNMSTCIPSGCHFQFSNRYVFELRVDMPLDRQNHSQVLPVSLIAAHGFLTVVEKLQTGTELQFNATFIEGMGSGKLTLHLSSLWFDDELYIEHDDSDEDAEKQYMLTKLFLSAKTTLSLVLEILFGYTSPGFYKH